MGGHSGMRSHLEHWSLSLRETVRVGGPFGAVGRADVRAVEVGGWLFGVEVFFLFGDVFFDKVGDLFEVGGLGGVVDEEADGVQVGV